MNATRTLKVAVDIGGTFVDAISYDTTTGEIVVHKVSTTPDEPARGVISSVDGLVDDIAAIESFAHGTTLGLNAILQRNGADVGVIANEGFSDLLEIARAAIPVSHMYDFSYQRPAPLVPRRHRRGVPGRLDAQGAEVVPLDEAALIEAARELIEQHGLGSIAICFLHSYTNPVHERRAADVLRAEFPGVQFSISSDLTREYREYERTSTVVLDAYIRPVLNNYLDSLETRLTEGGLSRPLHIMRSGGGAMTSDLAKQAPLTTVLSGPAGGVVGTTFLARELGLKNVLSFDVGGTSVDSCVVVDGKPSEIHEAEIDGLPLLIPIFDIRTIGAGGGSIAWMDEGLLKVGPQSAGAVPGPAAYQNGGTEPTVTDASFALGYLDPDAFLGGQMQVSAEAAKAAISDRIAGALGVDESAAAASILRILIARTVGALREITIERGLDPREFTLLAFGGAGPLLAPMLAREMEIDTTLVPRVPSAFSAFGMLMSDLEYEFAATSLRPLTDEAIAELEPTFAELRARAVEILEQQHVPESARGITQSLDIRYLGQEHALAVDYLPGESAADLLARFNELHLARHGHAMDESGQILSVRLRAVGRQPKPALVRIAEADRAAEPTGSRRAFDVATDAWADFAVYDRGTLLAGHRISGPAIVEEGTSTTVFFGDQELTVDEYGHLAIRRAPAVESIDSTKLTAALDGVDLTTGAFA
ncbi:hydantoinase/oxoprolinase family protein [Agromyces aerolatus]|uniref:hydantoinase/oxoprolinase family protein n=1 Tax=Agromyces sp. LY-1074 TaxID=3074080 RepID=UPI00286768D3|nr:MULTISPECIES: hydantoinase/oxoprolinase family protein [unclassified Agromyces]MDR5699038.1 hydantoinase/oxoprolinase family protein [Agromyces sp. LY-1074]MDR5705184.1 hydantoinase/oxoprolinase family protein [Agromyces sp. LY-1358]